MKVWAGTFLPLELRVAGGNTKSRWDTLSVELKELVWKYHHGNMLEETKKFMGSFMGDDLYFRAVYCSHPRLCHRVMDMMNPDFDASGGGNYLYYTWHRSHANVIGGTDRPGPTTLHVSILWSTYTMSTKFIAC